MNPYTKSASILSQQRAPSPLTQVKRQPLSVGAPSGSPGGNPYNNAGQILNYDRKTNPGMFTQYGFDPKGDNENIAVAKRLGVGMFPGLASGVGMYNEMAALRPDAYRAGLRALDPRADTQAKIDAERARNDALARAEMSQVATDMAEQGYGSGAIAGMQRGMMQQSSERTLDYQDMLADPEYQAQMWGLYQSMIESGMSIPGMEEFLGLTSAATNWTIPRKQMQQQGGGVLSGITNALGGAASAYFAGTGPFKRK